jgi:hypothetical protein
MPKFKENPNSFMKKYNSSTGKHAKPSPERFFGNLFGGSKGKGPTVQNFLDPAGIFGGGGLGVGGKIFGNLFGRKNK